MSESFDRNASHMAGKYVSYKEMTPNELADLLDSEDWTNNPFTNKTAKQAAAMLRDLLAQNEALTIEMALLKINKPTLDIGLTNDEISDLLMFARAVLRKAKEK
jgi:hypothetical protein